MDVVYHYPPELTQLLIDTIPLICRSKKDVLLFFRGSGLNSKKCQDLESKVNKREEGISKYLIARELIAEINEGGERTLRVRREVLKRVIEYEDFSTCWPADQLKAKGLVSEVRRVVNVKDSFTRMQNEVEKEKQQKRKAAEEVIRKKQKFNESLESVKKQFYSLFSLNDPQKRGKQLEKVLNELFSVYEVLLKESFAQYVDDVRGATDQVDGVIEFQGNTYLIEMKWMSENVGKDVISEHLIRVYHRGYTRGIFISRSNYTEPAINIAKEGLQRTVFVLITLDELVFLLERQGDLLSFLKDKIDAAMIEKIPYKRIVN